MSVIFAKNIWEENKAISKSDLINPKFECDIFVNDIKYSENMKINKENKIKYIFKKDFDNLSHLFEIVPH